jgi:hypothetical protein
MTEEKLRDYFNNQLTPEELSLDLKDSQKRTSYDVTSVYINNIEYGEFEIKKEHLVKLCEDVISGQLALTDLNTIGFALMASDYFTWDDNGTAGEILSNVIFEWDSPEIGFDLTIKNVLLWKDYLLTGIYRLDKNELKQKFRSKGKYKELYRAIDEILWTDWDPIGVNEVAPRDEYQSYTPTILNLKIREADTETIAKKLFAIETQTIGLLGDIDRCRSVADKIIKIK